MEVAAEADLLDLELAGAELLGRADDRVIVRVVEVLQIVRVEADLGREELGVEYRRWLRGVPFIQPSPRRRTASAYRRRVPARAPAAPRARCRLRDRARRVQRGRGRDGRAGAGRGARAPRPPGAHVIMNRSASPCRRHLQRRRGDASGQPSDLRADRPGARRKIGEGIDAIATGHGGADAAAVDAARLSRSRAPPALRGIGDQPDDGSGAVGSCECRRARQQAARQQPSGSAREARAPCDEAHPISLRGRCPHPAESILP